MVSGGISIAPHNARSPAVDVAARQPFPAASGKRERRVTGAPAWLRRAALALAASLALGAQAAPPYATSLCAADRVPNLHCTANDVEVARVAVLNNVTTCNAGELVSLDLRAFLHVNAQDRHDIGVFMATDGKSPVLPAASGGSASCAVFGVPQSPVPYANLDNNACGDFDRDGLPQGTEAALDLGLVTVTCKADADGYLDIPTVISWATGGTPTSCQAPMAAWVEPQTSSKCESGIAARIQVQVLGRIVVIKQTDPDGAAGSFSFNATGTGVTPAAFALSDGQSQTVTTAPLSATAQTYVVTEQQLAGWTPAAEIICRDIDGDIAPFAVVDNVNRTATVHMSASTSQVTCTFTNKKQGTITINKTALGGNGTFGFSGSNGIAPFSIATSGGTGQSVISGLNAGTYTITEAVPAGWNLTALTCTDPTGDTAVDLATGTATINLASAESVVCDYTDTRRGSITVVKSTAGGNATFDFTGPVSPASPGGNFQITTTAGTGQVVLADLLPGTHSVTEFVPAGWDLTNINCVDPSGGTSTAGSTATVGLAPGENVTCTFTDTRRGAIIVQKIAQGPDGMFNFAGSQSFAITTTGGSGQDTTAYASVAPGTYTITETVPPGWSLTALSCSDGSTTNLGTATATVGVSAGETVTCTFTNTRLASLTIVKHAIPHIAAPNTPSFSFTATGAGLTPAFSLGDDGTNPNSIAFTNLMPGGAYQVTEAPLANWPLVSLTCSDQSDPNPANRSTLNLAGLSIIPNLQPGEALTCAFTNARNDNGTIAVTKSTIGGTGSFDFTNSGGVVGSATNPAAFTITTTVQHPTESQGLSGLAAGTYTIVETTQAGWDLAPIQCTITNPPTGGSTTFNYAPAGNAVTINLGATGNDVDAVACAFTNTRRGSITIIKDATPEDAQDFTFDTTGGNGVPASFQLDDDADPALPNTLTFGSLPAGVYTFTEQAVASWRLTDIACAGGATVTTNPATGLASIDLHPGENVTCTYRNARDGTITITKVAIGGTGAETFVFTGPAPLAGSIGNGQSLSGPFPAGTYAVNEQVPAGWDLSNIGCTGGSVTITGSGTNPTSGFEPGDTSVNVTITSGQTVACTFTNTRRGSITIVKNTVGADGTFSFTGAQNFQVQTIAGTGQNTAAFASVAPGTYAVTETVPAGWNLTALACSNASAIDLATATVAVSVAAGEAVTCTFTDTKLGTIRIIKRIHADQTGAFSFSVPAQLEPSGTFALIPAVADTVASRVFENVVPGTYTIAETLLPAGWSLLGITCVDPTANTVVDFNAASATIALAPAETVECTFNNTQLSDITISVVSSGGTDMFGFASTNLGANNFALTTAVEGVKASRLFTGLLPGTYTVDGLGAPLWTLYDVFCLADSGETYWIIAGAGVSITVPHGESIECIYYYRLPEPVPPLPPPPIPTMAPWLYVLLGALLLAMGLVRIRRR